MPATPKGPPLRLVQAIDRVRAGLQKLHRSSVPGNIALLELATGAWTTQVLYVAAKLGIADRPDGRPGPSHRRGGKERTRAQYTELLERAGFRLSRVISTVSPISVIEAFAV